MVAPEREAGLGEAGRLAADDRVAAVLRAAAGLADATVRRPAAGLADAAVRLAGDFAADAVDLRVAAGFAADAEDLPAADRFAAAAGFAVLRVVAEDERPRVAAPPVSLVAAAAGDLRFAADAEELPLAAVVLALDEDLEPRTADGRDVVGFAAGDAEVPVVADGPPRRANGFLAAVALPAVRRVGAAEPPRGLTSNAAMRLLSPSTSLRRPLISASTRSSSTSRMRLAAFVTSFARPRVDLAPSAEAVNVRSTAWRTASTASAAPAAALSFLLRFLSFFGMAGRS